MAYIVVGREQLALQIGENVLGGDADEVLAIPPLVSMAPFARIDVLPDEESRIVAIDGGAGTTVNGEPLDATPRPLPHGARIACGDVVVLYGDMRSIGSTSSVRGVRDDDLAALNGIGGATPTADTGGRLYMRHDGVMYPVPDGGLVIGRDPSCDIVLASKEVSRRHASIRPSLQGYLLADTSANGVLVNGVPVRTAQVLGQGDIIRIGDDEFRFEADAAPPDLSVVADTSVAATARPAPPPGSAPAGPLLATLEILNGGPLRGTRFRIERPVIQVGRGAHNDVRLQDESVSSSHATLLLRDGRWHVLDLGSKNGSYVDGTRTTGDAALSPPAELRFGNIKLLFRALGKPGSDTKSTRGIVGVRDEELAADAGEPRRGRR